MDNTGGDKKYPGIEKTITFDKKMFGVGKVLMGGKETRIFLEES